MLYSLNRYNLAKAELNILKQLLFDNNLKIGFIPVNNITILAPLAGITNLPFRLLAKKFGCGLVCSEMVSANGLIRNSKKTIRLLDSSPEEKPLSVQIFGADPSIMADAAQIVESIGADILDINFGCPVKKVVKTGAGAALMKSPEKAETLIKAVRKAVNIPLTIKIRRGWDKSEDQAFKISQIAERNGVDAIAIHPRTAVQGFRRKADWSIIAGIKRKVSIPVIGNGDIIIPEDAVKMKNETACDAVMIGRAAIGSPWIFSQVLAILENKKKPEVDLPTRFDIMISYLESSIKYFGEKNACYMMRSRLGWFVKGLYGSSKFRESIKQISSKDHAIKLVKEYKEYLASFIASQK